ncbi:hypothetical protein V9L05_05140 [Bernardetia sp. Wsw4-3y2]|uniref:hypothetical protein n=1 Tax=Bernardetia sp. Wsw4-3y2 TaxID=3127471 RepID=UPI0030CF2E06
MTDNIILKTHLYKIKVKCMYPSIEEARKLVQFFYKHRIREGEYRDLEYEAKYLSSKYSIKGVNKWTANMAISDNIYIPIKLFNYLVHHHIYVNYELRLTDTDIQEIQNLQLKKIKILSICPIRTLEK